MTSNQPGTETTSTPTPGAILRDGPNRRQRPLRAKAIQPQEVLGQAHALDVRHRGHPMRGHREGNMGPRMVHPWACPLPALTLMSLILFLVIRTTVRRVIVEQWITKTGHGGLRIHRRPLGATTNSPSAASPWKPLRLRAIEAMQLDLVRSPVGRNFKRRTRSWKSRWKNSREPRTG